MFSALSLIFRLKLGFVDVKSGYVVFVIMCNVDVFREISGKETCCCLIGMLAGGERGGGFAGKGMECWVIAGSETYNRDNSRGTRMPSSDVSYKICLTLHLCRFPISLQWQERK